MLGMGVFYMDMSVIVEDDKEKERHCRPKGCFQKCRHLGN